MTLETLLRIAIVGPECSGKTDLAMRLAAHYNTVWVPEFARQYIDRLKRPYEKEDLLKIARWQMFTEDELALQANRLLICDTNLVVIKVWSEFKYGSCDGEILAMMFKRTYQLHFLTHPDVPWENDPQREHPDKREALFQLYKGELESLQVPFIEILGSREERIKLATKAINSLLS